MLDPPSVDKDVNLFNRLISIGIGLRFTVASVLHSLTSILWNVPVSEWKLFGAFKTRRIAENKATLGKEALRVNLKNGGK